MAKMNADIQPRLAAVSWSADDIQTVRPEMTTNECLEFLVYNARYIQDAMVQSGWNAIEALLPPRKQEEDE